MPNIESAKKRVKVTNKRNLLNKTRKSSMRTAIKRFYEAVDSNADNKLELMNIAIKKVDKAAAKNLIHKNAASRKKAQLMKACSNAQ